MYTGWPTAGSNGTRRRRLPTGRLLLAALTLTLAAGCSLLPPEDEQENVPAQIRVPKISQKPEYPVRRATLETKVSGSGKLMSEREEKLYYTQDNRRIADVYIKAGDRVKKGQTLAQLDTGDTESQIRRKEIDVEKAQLDLKEAMRNATASEDGSVLLRKQQLDYELLQDELADLKKELADAKLTAPFDGTIVSFTAEKGDLTKAYDKIGQIADMSSLVVAVQFSSSDLANVAPGMETLVSINTAGDVKGTVRRLPVESADPGAAADEDSLDAYTLIEVPKLPTGIGHGTPLSAAVVVERRKDVLSIPSAALRKQNNRNYVLVANADGSKGEVDVEIGVTTDTDVEIIKGLAEGQKVVGK